MVLFSFLEGVFLVKDLHAMEVGSYAVHRASLARLSLRAHSFAEWFW